MVLLNATNDALTTSHKPPLLDYSHDPDGPTT